MKGAGQWVGLALLLLAAAAVGTYTLVARSGGSAKSIETVHGLVGGEKIALLDDPEVQKILRDRYGIAVDATKAGSIEMVEGDTSGQDFLWPSSRIALDLFKSRHGASVATATTFDSPIVLYAWSPVADALARTGYLHVRKGVRYVTDFPRLSRMIVRGKPWSSVGLGQVYGPISIFTTDPNKSNSGLMFAGLLANALNGDRVVTEPELAHVLPDVEQVYGRLGYLETSSLDLFNQFLATGIGAKPVIAGYENQLIEFTVEHPSQKDNLQRQIRILYPQPTVWSEHILIALDGRGKRLLDALNDSDIQRLAWERHGFRSGVLNGSNDPAAAGVTGVPRDITSIIPVPAFRVMNQILNALART